MNNNELAIQKLQEAFDNLCYMFEEDSKYADIMKDMMTLIDEAIDLIKQ